MKPNISALLDDELEQSEASRTIDALRRDKALQETWNLYHLIGDALRHAPGYSPDLSAKVIARLSEEPVLFVPSAQPKRTPLRFALPLAAKPRPANEPATPVAEQSPSGALKEYLVAHQAHSPSSGIQGVAPYVRSVSEIRQGGRP
jgi:sigma-E factor negative regulatory protein RseA